MPELPHVTTILKTAGLIDTTWFTDQGRDRGSALHEATHYLDEGDLKWDTVDESIASRLSQYQRFKEQVQPEILSIEEAVTNSSFQYCGRLDRRVRINGREGVLDIKSPSRSPWQALQVALYALCFDRPMARWTLHLSEERYQLIEHRDRKDYAVAKAAVLLAAWRQKHGGE